MKGFLKRRRKDLKLTAKEMAMRLDSSPSRVFHYETEMRFPTAPDIWTVMLAYEMTKEELLDWLEYINKNNQ